jgi:hypothetical protein
VIRNGSHYVLAGTLALAGIGAVVANQGLPKASSLSNILPSVQYQHGYHHGWHRHHDGAYWQYYEMHGQYGGTIPNGTSVGGNAFVGRPGAGYYQYYGGRAYDPSSNGY